MLHDHKFLLYMQYVMLYELGWPAVVTMYANGEH